MFTIGAYVMYRSEGVCKIADIRQETFGTVGNGATYYILTPLNDPKTTLFVPTENELLVSYMRPLLSAEEICALTAELREERIEWIPENRIRNARFREILALGDRRELIVLVHTLLERIRMTEAAGKRIAAGDEQALRRATKLLLDEFSTTTDLSNEVEVLAVLMGEHTPKSREIAYIEA